jgi:hypothetical protein
VTVSIRATDYERFHAIHTLSDYLLFLVLWVTAFISLVRAKKTILANLSLLLALWIAAEIFCFFLLGIPFRPLYSYPTQKLKTDGKLNQLGYLPDPSQAINHVSVVEGDTLFDVDYTIDAMHRRIVPENPSRLDSIQRKAYVLFWGCSVTCGFGVEDDETLPYFFEQYHPEYKAYKGYGTQNALAHLEREEIRSELEETEGFADDRKRVSIFYEWGLESQIIKYFDVSFPARLQRAHLEQTTDIILETQRRYEEKFGNARFYVLLYPDYFSWINKG